MYGRVLRCLAASTAALMFAGCGLLLDFDPPDPTIGSVDASMFDAGQDGDILVTDANIRDADSLDGSTDSGLRRDANIDRDGSIDGDIDSGPIDAGMRRCEDTTEGYCFRFENLEGSPEVTGWMIQYIWTLPGGAIYREPDNSEPDGVSVYAPACDVFRRIDARTTECEVSVPDPGMPTLGAGPFYAYPTYASGPACSSSCPAYPSGYRMWSSGVEFSTAPADGRVSQESRPTSAGTIIILRLIP